MIEGDYSGGQEPILSGGFDVASGHVDVLNELADLATETTYKVCLGARDTQKPSNLQPETNNQTFKTLDITPPDLKGEIMNGSLTAHGYKQSLQQPYP